MTECVIIDCRHTRYHAGYCYRHAEAFIFADE